MKSIYQQYLGSDFQKLHPQLQRRLGLHSQSGEGFIGRGMMDRIWRGPVYTLPFLQVGTYRHIMFPNTGKNIPFSIENYAWQDPLGRETVSWIRRFRFPQRTRCFDATMIYSYKHNKIIDYLGTHQHLAVDIEMNVKSNGGIQIKAGAQRFYEGGLAFGWPMLFSGFAEVNEYFDDEAQEFKVDVQVSNPVFGKLFGYHGHFRPEYVPLQPGDIPKHALPLRYEGRE